MIQASLKQIRSQRGVSMVEFALAAPVFFLFLFGIIQAGLVMKDRVALEEGVRDGAAWAATLRDPRAPLNAVTASNAAEDHVRKLVAAQLRNTAPTLDVVVTSEDTEVDSDTNAWGPGDTVKVVATYPWSIDIFGLGMGGRFKTTTQSSIE